MHPSEALAIESRAMGEFARVMRAETPLGSRPSGAAVSNGPARLNIKQEDVKNGLGKLVLTLVKLLHELMEKQAIQRMEAGSLTSDQIERLGVALMRQTQEIDRLRREFNLDEEDLNLDLGPLGRLL